MYIGRGSTATIIVLLLWEHHTLYSSYESFPLMDLGGNILSPILWCLSRYQIILIKLKNKLLTIVVIILHYLFDVALDYQSKQHIVYSFFQHISLMTRMKLVPSKQFLNCDDGTNICIHLDCNRKYYFYWKLINLLVKLNYQSRFKIICYWF